MKKLIVFVLLLSVLCALFVGCTTKKPEDESANVSLPTMNVPDSRENLDPDTGKGSEPVPGLETRDNEDPDTGRETESLPGTENPENGNHQQNTDPAPGVPSSSEQKPVNTEEPDPEETGTEYIVDGGNGFGFGGN